MSNKSINSIEQRASIDQSRSALRLAVQEVDGTYRPATGDEVIAAARGAIAKRFRRGAAMTTMHITHEFLRLRLSGLLYEVFCVLFLDNRHRLIEYRELFRGTIDSASVYPREVAKEALDRNAAAVILAHCHPSGVAEPSSADQIITARLKEALALLDIRVLDHLVIGGADVVSFATRGIL